MKIIGIDASLNGTGIIAGSIIDNLFVMKLKRVFTDLVSDQKADKEKIFVFYKTKQKSENSKLYRMEFVYDYLIKIINHINPEYVCIEDYAYAGKGKVFDIAELVGNIKLYLFKKNIKIRLYPPTSVKMFIAENGLAKKEQITKAVLKKYGIDFNAYNSKKYGGSSDKFKGESGYDLADAFSLCQLLTTEILLRNGNIKLSDLTQKQIQVFNAVSKSNPENILVRQFIYKEQQKNG